MSHHPALYGLKNFDKHGTEERVRNGLNEYLLSMTKTKVSNNRYGTGMWLHPLFVEMQEKSPMMKNENYTLPEIDWDQHKMSPR